MRLKELLNNTRQDDKAMIISIISDEDEVMGVVGVIDLRNEEINYEWDYNIEMTDEIKDKQIYYELRLDNDNYSPLNTIFDLKNDRVVVLKPEYLKSIAKDLNLNKDVDLDDIWDILGAINLEFNNNPEILSNINNLEKKAHIIGIDEFNPLPLINLSF